MTDIELGLECKTVIIEILKIKYSVYMLNAMIDNE